MGMFDSLYVPCGNCGTSVKFESKAGECTLAKYDIYDCPPAVAGDLIGQSCGCKCGAIIQLRGAVTLTHETLAATGVARAMEYRDAGSATESPEPRG